MAAEDGGRGTDPDGGVRAAAQEEEEGAGALGEGATPRALGQSTTDKSEAGEDAPTLEEADAQLLKKIEAFQEQREEERKRMFRTIVWLSLRCCAVGAICSGAGHGLRIFLPEIYVGGVILLIALASFMVAVVLLTCVPHDLLDVDDVMARNPKSSFVFYFLTSTPHLLQIRFYPHLDIIKPILLIGFGCVASSLMACGLRAPRWWPLPTSIISWYFIADGFSWAAVYFFYEQNDWLEIPEVPSLINSSLNLLYAVVGVGVWVGLRWRYRDAPFGRSESLWVLSYVGILGQGVRRTFYGGAWIAMPSEGSEDPIAGALEVARGATIFFILGAMFAIGRKRCFRVVGSRFDKDGARLRRDGAFVAELLETIPVKVGQSWWVHRDAEDESYPQFDPRRCWQRGVVVDVAESEFVTRLQEARAGGHRIRNSVSSNASHDPMTVKLPLPSVGKTESKEELLSRAQRDLRCVEFENLSPELMHRVDSRGKPELQAAWHALSRPVRPGEKIDDFMSNSWYDNPEVKWKKLVEVAERFHKRNGRYPTIWLDKLCIDQTRITDGLKVLPVNVMACTKLLALCGNTYLSRLWCIWELFTLFSFVSESVALERIEFVFLGTDEEGMQMLDGMANFHVSTAHCYDPNEEARLLKVIDAVGTTRFNRRISNMAALTKERLEKQSKNRDGSMGRTGSVTKKTSLRGWSPKKSNRSITSTRSGTSDGGDTPKPDNSAIVEGQEQNEVHV